MGLLTVFSLPRLSLRQELIAFTLTLLGLLGLTLGLSSLRVHRAQTALQTLSAPLLQLSLLVSTLDQSVLEQGVMVAQVERQYWEQRRAQIPAPIASPTPTPRDRPRSTPTPRPTATPTPIAPNPQPLLDHDQETQELLAGTLALVDRQIPPPPIAASDLPWVEMATQLRGLAADYQKLHDRSLALLEIPNSPDFARLRQELDRDRSHLHQQLLDLQTQLQDQREVQHRQTQVRLKTSEKWAWSLRLGLVGSVAGAWGLRLTVLLAQRPW
ncbi:MAG: hypothetical protein VKK80_00490 [Prochlorothrix sp.]|nr:hypothetical protein [Prochlorothrix sp.]